MNREDIIAKAREAGFSEWAVGLSEMPAHLEHFAKLVAEHEREAVLDLVDGYAKNNTDLADAIRARGRDTSMTKDEALKQAFDASADNLMTYYTEILQAVEE